MCFDRTCELFRLFMPLGIVMAIVLIGPANLEAEDYNLLGYEGIGTLGSSGSTSGPPPVVADWVTTHCRYIDVQNTVVGHYYLRYPLDLPDGATVTDLRFYLADFNDNGSVYLTLRSRPWNSRDIGTTETFLVSPVGAPGDIQMDSIPLGITINNQTTEYWIDVSPQNNDFPGQLCVYGIQVTYN